MRLITLFFALCLTVFSNAQDAEWELQESGTANNLTDVYFVNSDVGYIVGDEATILKTNNGGEKWEILETEITDHLKTLWFHNEQTGFVAAAEGNSLYRTDDGGQSWTEIETDLSENPSDNINTIYFIDENVGFLGSVSGMSKTTDGGVTWKAFDIDYPLVAKIDFYDSLIGYAAYSQGILKTIDGGETWEIHKLHGADDFNNGAILRSIQAKSIDTVYFGASYYSAFYSSVDGGENLDYQWISIFDMDFLTSQKGFAISVSQNFNTTILKTTNMGQSWSEQYVSANNLSVELKALWMHNENEGWAVGRDGEIRYMEVLQPNSVSNFSQKNITVYPNPTVDVLSILDKNIKADKIQILDMTGRICAVYSNDVKFFDVSNLTAGSYFLQLISDGKMNNTLFIKE